MSKPTASLLTVGEIARRLSAPLHKVEYIIKARKVASAARAGNARVFTEADVDYIAAELRRVEAQKGGL